MNPQCATCKHSIGRAIRTGSVVVWCVLHNRVALQPCAAYEREPGADD